MDVDQQRSTVLGRESFDTVGDLLQLEIVPVGRLPVGNVEDRRRITLPVRLRAAPRFAKPVTLGQRMIHRRLSARIRLHPDLLANRRYDGTAVGQPALPLNGHARQFVSYQIVGTHKHSIRVLPQGSNLVSVIPQYGDIEIIAVPLFPPAAVEQLGDQHIDDKSHRFGFDNFFTIDYHRFGHRSGLIDQDNESCRRVPADSG